MKKLNLKQLNIVQGAGGGGLAGSILGGLVSGVMGSLGGTQKLQQPTYLPPPAPVMPSGMDEEASKEDLDAERTDKARARAQREQQSKAKNLLFLEEDEGE